MLRRNAFCLTLILIAALGSLAPLTLSQAAPSNVAQASEKQLADFRADPLRLLAKHPIGGAQMSAIVKALVVADASLIDELLVLAAQGNGPQASAIGVGIGQAVKVLDALDRTLVQAISRKIASNTNGNLMAGYSLGSGDVQTLAVTGAGTAAGTTAAGAPSSAGSGLATGVSGFFIETARPSTPAISTFSTITTQTTQSFAGATAACTQSVSPRSIC